MVDIWITSGTFDPLDTANPVFAAYDNAIYPEKIHILTPEDTRKSVQIATSVLKALAEGEGKKMDVIHNDISSDPRQFRDQTSELFNEVAGSEIALDITGRPSVYATLLVQQAVSDDVPVDHIFHLNYEYPPDSFEDNLYPLIPKSVFTLRDILSEYKSEGKDD